MPWFVWLGIGILVGGCLGVVVGAMLAAASEIDHDRDQGNLLP